MAIINHSFRRIGGITLNAISFLSHTIVFIGSLTIIWGWTGFSLCSCLVLVASLIDLRAAFKETFSRKFGPNTSSPMERAYAIYLLSLGGISIFLNLALVVFRLSFPTLL